MSVFDRCIPEPNSGCWLWEGYAAKSGHGRLSRNGRTALYAHREAYREHFGEIPEGMFVCHKCDNPPCINPDHLFLGSAADNVHDMHQKGRARNWHSSKTHCPRGHEYTEANTYIDCKRGWRQCRACMPARWARQDKKRREK